MQEENKDKWTSNISIIRLLCTIRHVYLTINAVD